jgi:anti-sigma B factor antagonist
MNDMDAMDVEIRVTPEGAIVVPVGEIDLGRAPAFREHLTRVQRERPERLIVDLGQVPYMDSSGVATLVEAMQTARRSGSRLVLCNLQERVRSIFEIARLETVFVIVASVEEGKSA